MHICIEFIILNIFWMVSDFFIIYIYYPEFLYVKPASREGYF